MKEVKKHLGILGRPPSAYVFNNSERLYCKNCKITPDKLRTKQWFRPARWWPTIDTCDWWVCSDCYTPLKMKE